MHKEDMDIQETDTELGSELATSWAQDPSRRWSEVNRVRHAFDLQLEYERVGDESPGLIHLIANRPSDLPGCLVVDQEGFTKDSSKEILEAFWVTDVGLDDIPNEEFAWAFGEAVTDYLCGVRNRIALSTKASREVEVEVEVEVAAVATL
jgi:hypothetical protein